MPLHILGVDIGNSGALAIVSPAGELLDVVDMPVLNDGPAGRPAVNGPLLAAALARLQPATAFVEYVGPRPGEGAVQRFSFGRARGLVEGALAMLDVPVRLLTPPVWKREVGIKPGATGAKDAARSEAVRRWPGKAEQFAAKGSDGRAEAALIAVIAYDISLVRSLRAPDAEDQKETLFVALDSLTQVYGG